MAAKDDNGGKLIINLALIAGAYVFVAKPLLKKLGVDPVSTATVTEYENMDSERNPFTFLYSNGDYKKGVSQQLLKSYWDAYQDDPNNANIPANLVNAVVHASALYDAFHDFPQNTFGSAFNQVSTIFSQVRDKREVSDIDGLLISGSRLGNDLWTLLRNGHQMLPFLTFANNGLSDNELATIINHVSALPADITNPQLQ